MRWDGCGGRGNRLKKALIKSNFCRLVYACIFFLSLLDSCPSKRPSFAVRVALR